MDSANLGCKKLFRSKYMPVLLMLGLPSFCILLQAFFPLQISVSWCRFTEAAILLFLELKAETLAVCPAFVGHRRVRSVGNALRDRVLESSAGVLRFRSCYEGNE